MKKAMTILLSLIMIFSMAACGNTADQTEQSSAEESTAEESTAKDSTDNEETLESGADDAENTDTETQGAKVLVAYFSATNTTKGVAEHIADGLNADIYEIVPEEPYTDADLDYNDNNSRTTIEMDDPDARPGISGSVENMVQYDIVFVGYAGGIIGLN